MIKNKGILKKYSAIFFVLIIGFGISIASYSGKIDIGKFIENSPTNAALKYYEEKYGGGKSMEGVRASLIKLGCHQEIRIYKGDELVMKAIYDNGRIFEMSW